MPEQYKLRDRDGNEIGTAERVPSGGDTLIGSLLLLGWLRENPGCLIVSLVLILIGFVISGVMRLGHNFSVNQIASRIETISLVGRYAPEMKTLVVDYQLISHNNESNQVAIGVQLPLEWYNCDNGYGHTWVYGGSTTEGEPAVAWITLPSNSIQQGTIRLDSSPGYGFGYYVEHCQYKIGQPTLQVINASK